MRISACVLTTFALVTPLGSASSQELHDPLLDHMIGEWVLEGTIAGDSVTHDVAFDWVLGRQYVRVHEVAREREASGAPAYEAIVFIGWDQPSQRYACLWLDSTGGSGLSAQGIGYGAASGDSIPFLFHFPDGSPFHNTFIYDARTDTWRWHLDGERNGEREPFARVTLRRKR